MALKWSNLLDPYLFEMGPTTITHGEIGFYFIIACVFLF